MKQGITKKEFVAKLEELLRVTRLEISELKLQEIECGTYITVIYDDGSSRIIDVTGDSGIAMIRDVCYRL